MELKDYCHLLKRATLSVSPEQINVVAKSKEEAVDFLFKKSTNITPLTIEYETWNNAPYNSLSDSERKKIQEYNRKKLIDYNKAWFNRLCLQSDNLRERMVLFWANHFVVMSKMIEQAVSYNNTLRKYALGNFRDLTVAVAKEAAMIDYLDSNKNKKQAPNENFARELMELFTLGRDVIYTENDVKEAAKAFTGWRTNSQGDFMVAKGLHDKGEKLFLGKKGNFNGEDIITIILEQRECAKFVCTKIYKEFVNQIINENHVEELTDVFYKDYNIERVMHYLFLSDWFYEEQNIASKVKSPVELLVSLYLLFPFTLQKENQLMYFQKNLGQVLLQPPNVAGWPGGLNWIDSNTLMLRLRLPSLIINQGIIDTDTYNEQSNKLLQRKTKNKLKIMVVEDKLPVLKSMDNNKIYMMLYGREPSNEIKSLIEDNNYKERFIKMLSVPDFQMC